MSIVLERQLAKMLRKAGYEIVRGPHNIRVGGKKMRALKTHLTKRYKRERIAEPKAFDPRSFRVIDPGRPGHTKMIVACPKGFFRGGRCRVGMKVQAVLRER
jgi:hypothetical protein